MALRLGGCWSFLNGYLKDCVKLMVLVGDLKDGIIFDIIDHIDSWYGRYHEISFKIDMIWLRKGMFGLGGCWWFLTGDLEDWGELLDTYKQQILGIIEYAAPVWTPALTKSQINQIERVQRTAIYIILGEKFTSYKRGLKQLGLETLEKKKEVVYKFYIECLKAWQVFILVCAKS